MNNIIIINLLIVIIVFTIIIVYTIIIIVFPIITNKISSDKPEVSLTRDDGEQVIREGEDLRSQIHILQNNHESSKLR